MKVNESEPFVTIMMKDIIYDINPFICNATISGLTYM